MCDTFVVPGHRTAAGWALFGKNSDREPNEAQEIVLVPAQDHAAGASLRCTYIEIPQAAHTHAVLLSKPFWMWGAEMGVNENGVAIGNEAVFTRLPYEKGAALTGMDLLRLGLERGASADEALQVIITLLEQYGQGGNCGYEHPLYYHNSFIIADAGSAWVLETAGREWAAEKVKDVRSISNAITIGSDWERASQNLVSLATERKWCRGREDFSFSGCYSDFLFTRFSAAKYRQSCTTHSLEAKQGQVRLQDAMELLRSHGGAGPEWRPDKAVVGAEVCMHGGFGPVRGSQSVASMVVELKPGDMTVWLTGTSAPCTGIFKPVWMAAGLPWKEPTLQGTYSPEVMFWRHEQLHRETLLDYPTRIQLYAAERDALEARFREMAVKAGQNAVERSQVSRGCFELASQAEAAWYERVRQAPVRDANVFYYQSTWRKYSRDAQMPSES